MTDEQLIEFKNLSMQDGKLNLSWFADYVAQAEREECAKVCESLNLPTVVGKSWDEGTIDCAKAIRARKQA